MEERWLWKTTIFDHESCEIIEWAIADNIDQLLQWINGTLGDESEVVKIERVSLAEILPSATHTAIGNSEKIGKVG